MKNTVRVPGLAIYQNPVIAVADRLETYPAYADRFQILKNSFVGMRNDDTISFAIQKKIHYNGLDPRRPCHVHFRFYVYLPGKRIDNALIALFGVGHKVDSQGTDQLRDLMAGRHNLRIICQGSVACATDSIGI